MATLLAAQALAQQPPPPPSSGTSFLTIVKVGGGVVIVGALGFGVYWVFSNIGNLPQAAAGIAKDLVGGALDVANDGFGTVLGFQRDALQQQVKIAGEAGKLGAEGVNGFLGLDLKKGEGTVTPKDVIGKVGSVIPKIGGIF